MTCIPSKTEILDWITEHPTKAAKRDIAKAFGIKGAARIDLKRVLRELEDEGKLTKRKSSYRDANALPPVSVLQITGPDGDGDLYAKPGPSGQVPLRGPRMESWLRPNSLDHGAVWACRKRGSYPCWGTRRSLGLCRL